MIIIKKINDLNELDLSGYKHIKNNEWKLPDNLIEWLEERNFSLIGSGVFSDVYKSETEDFVVKINNKEGFDRAYLKFAEYCYLNKNNKHLPKVGKVKIFKLQDGDDDYEEYWYVLFIEKLQPYSVDLFGFEDHTTLLGPMAHGNINTIEKIKDFLQQKELDYSPSKEQFSQIIECVNTLINIKEKLNVRNFDLHDGNIMQRNGIAVIIDPMV